MKTKKTKISPIMIWGASLSVIFIILFGGFSVYEARQLANLAKELYEHPLAVSNALRDIRANINAMHRSMKDVVLSESSEQQAAYVATIDALEKEALKSFDLVEERFLGDKKIVLSSRNDFEGWRLIRNQVIKLMKQGKQDAAVAITKGKSVKHIALINMGPEGKTGINYLTNFANDKAKEFQSMVVQKEKTAVMEMSILLILSIVLSIIIVIIFIRSFKTAAALEKSEERLNLAISGSNDGIWDWDISNNNVWWSPRIFYLLGYQDKEYKKAQSAFLDFLHPDDKDKVRAKLVAHLKNHEPFDIQFQMKTKQGDYHWFRGRGQAHWDEHGRAVRMAGSVQAITEIKQAEEVLKWRSDVDAAMAELSRALLSLSSLEDISFLILEHAQRLTKSKLGYVGYIDPQTGYLISPTMTREVWYSCQIPDKDIVFKKFGGLWGWVLESREPLVANKLAEHPKSSGTPKGHIPIHRFLSAPAIIDQELVGQVALANSDGDYTEQDLVMVERLASLYALAIQRTRTEKMLQQRTFELNERVKELKCLYSISNLMDRQSHSAGEIFQQIVDLIPPSWQYPEITCAKLVLEGKVFKTKNFNETPWKLAVDVINDEKKIGALEVHYLEEKEEIDGGPFLKEEKNLIKNIAKQLTDYIKHKCADAELSEYRKHLEDMVEQRTDQLKKSNEDLQNEVESRKQAEVELRETKDYLENIIESSLDCIVVTDSEGSIIKTNSSFQNLLGYENEEVIGRHPREFSPPAEGIYESNTGDKIAVTAELFNDINAMASKLFETGQVSNWERYLMRKDRKLVPVDVNIVFMYDTKANRIGTVGIIRDITARKRSEEALKKLNKEILEEHEQRKILSKKLITITENERRSIAMELHDHIGQSLTTLKMDLEKLHNQGPRDPTIFNEIIGTAQEKTVSIIRDVKTIAAGLMPAMLDTFGLVFSLEALLNKFDEDSTLTFHFFNNNVPKRFDQEKELALYRITQEALTNTIKYAKAKEVYVNLIKKEKSMILTVEDDGIGFDQSHIIKKISSDKGGMGLLIMKERALQLNGEFTIDSRIHSGTNLSVEIPL